MVDVVASVDFLAIPADGEGFTLDTYIQRLLRFAELKELGVLSLLTSSQSLVDLYAKDFYPLAPRLRSWISKTGEVAYSPADIERVVSSLFHEGRTLEELAGVEDILWENEFRHPNVAAQFAQLDSSLGRELVMMALWEQLLERRPAFLAIREVEHHSIKVSAKVTDVIVTGDMLAVPIGVDAVVGIGGGLKCTLLNCDPIAAFREADDVDQATVAIKLFLLLELLEEHPGSGFSDIPAFALQSGFLRTLDQHGARNSLDSAETVLRAVAACVRRRSLAGGHRLRISKAKGAPDRMRGNDYAWRQRVDYAFRIHAWVCSWGVELSRFVAHEDFEITE